jgi:DNA repair protein RadC
MREEIIQYEVYLKKKKTRKYKGKISLSSCSVTKEFFKKFVKVSNWHNEKFGMICLDTQNNVIGFHLIFEGDTEETTIYTKQIAIRAILNNSSSIILFHNHPGGCLNPSPQDLNLVTVIKSALEPLSIKVIDSMILTDEYVVSMAERGMI